MVEAVKSKALTLKPDTHMESVLKLRESLLRSDSDIKSGRVHSIDETAAAMRQAILDASK
jgi:hypothetical protein